MPYHDVNHKWGKNDGSMALFLETVKTFGIVIGYTSASILHGSPPHQHSHSLHFHSSLHTQSIDYNVTEILMSWHW